jgi:NhaA family Na+:H+ antiporter
MADQGTLPASHWSETPIARVLGPMHEFVHRSASSGVVLIVVTLVALVLANSGLAQTYTAVLESSISIAVGPFVLKESVLHWINDGLMAIFFFLVGLEIKREVTVGELANLRTAMLPIVAAIGGVLMPALIYAALNFNGIGVRGWGVPMATDIAFALGCLALLGDRIPFGLKIFLTAVAIVDDLIAVLVIALFYSGGLNFGALGVGFGVLVALALANIFGIRTMLFYLGFGVILWLAFLQSGVHATIAGVVLAFTIPARNRIDAPTFVRRAGHILQRLDPTEAESMPMLTAEAHLQAVIDLENLCEQVEAPLQKLEHALHTWVHFLIMPIFALANAGVSLTSTTITGETSFVALGIVLGLIVGKPIGLFSAAWLGVRTGIAELPPRVRWRHILGASILGGIGFTMSLFIASLAFLNAEVLATAKLAILIASFIAATTGVLLLSRVQDGEHAQHAGRVHS